MHRGAYWPELGGLTNAAVRALFNLIRRPNQIYYGLPLGGRNRPPVHRGAHWPALERKESNLKGAEDLYLEDKATIWPRLSYMCHIRNDCLVCAILAR